MKHAQELVNEFRLKQIADLLRSATGMDRKELLEERAELIEKTNRK